MCVCTLAYVCLYVCRPVSETSRREENRKIKGKNGSEEEKE